MEWGEIEIRKDDLGSIEATQRGDYVKGDGGYSVVITGWGRTEPAARENLTEAVDALARADVFDLPQKTPEA